MLVPDYDDLAQGQTQSTLGIDSQKLLSLCLSLKSVDYNFVRSQMYVVCGILAANRRALTKQHGHAAFGSATAPSGKCDRFAVTAALFPEAPTSGAEIRPPCASGAYSTSDAATRLARRTPAVGRNKVWSGTQLARPAGTRPSCAFGQLAPIQPARRS